MASRREEPIPPSQMFRTLLLHMLETHKILTPIQQHSTSKELKWCHQQNVYILSEIGSWLADLTEGSDLTPSFSPAQSAELLAGVVSCLDTPKVTPPPIAPTTPTARPAPTDLPPGIRRAASSRRRVSTPPAWERNSDGKIVFLQKSSSGKPSSISLTPSSDISGGNNNSQESES